MAWRKSEVEVFARTITKTEKITVGDSTLVSIILYASAPFNKVECTTKNIKTEGGYAHPLRIRSHNANSRVRENGKIYYTYVYEQYIVGSEKTGTLKMPELKFNAEFVIYDEPVTPYHEFWGIQPENHIANEVITLPAFSIEVAPRPKRSTKEMMQHGGVL